MSSGPLQNLIDQARTNLASRLGVPASSITVQQAAEHDWPDSSLGCPEPGMMYSQVITPGYLIILQVNGKSYEYHASRTHVVTCQK